MKRPSHVSLKIVYTLILSCLISCKQEHKKSEPTPLKVEAPSNIISLNEANVIYENYTKHRVGPIEQYETQQRQPTSKFEASRYVDFDYDTLKQYIAYIDQEAKLGGVKKVTKLRLYFANYPNKENFKNGKKVVHKRQNSIFMVPTLKKEGIDQGFFIGANGKAELISDWKSSTTNTVGLSLYKNQKVYAGFTPNFTLNPSIQGGKSLAFNYGQGGPPPKSDF